MEVEVIEQKPLPVQHKVKRITPIGEVAELVDVDVADGTIPFPQVYIPKEAYADRRLFYELPDATDEEIREKVIDESIKRSLREDAC